MEELNIVGIRGSRKSGKCDGLVSTIEYVIGGTSNV